MKVKLAITTQGGDASPILKIARSVGWHVDQDGRELSLQLWAEDSLQADAEVRVLEKCIAQCGDVAGTYDLSSDEPDDWD